MASHKDPASPPLARRRRKDARPAEIVAVAAVLFVELGFAATRMELVAERAGVAKGTVFRYFTTKEDLFRAVAAAALSNNLNVLEAAARRTDVPLSVVLRELLTGLSQGASSPGAAIAGVVLSESRTFPDLARAWHDEVAGKVLQIFSTLIKHAQERGEIRPGDPRTLAFCVVGPLIMGALFGMVFGKAGARPPNLRALADEQANTLLSGLFVSSLPIGEKS